MSGAEFLQDNLLLVGLVAVSGGMLMWSLFSSRITGSREVGPTDATRLINDDALIIDVREDGEFRNGHIANARHIPLGQLGTRLKELEKFKDKPIVVNCRSGARSARACSTLRRAGFTQVHNLAGGIMAWQQAGLPTTKK
jgi:rhodanese-related sulfurtransferase